MSNHDATPNKSFMTRLKHAYDVVTGRKGLLLPNDVASSNYRILGVFGDVATGTVGEKSDADILRKNALVFSCVGSWILSFIEAPLRDYAEDGEVLRDSPIRQLVKAPNPEQSESQFMALTLAYLGIGGTAALYKIRNKQGMVIGLVPYPITMMKPFRAANSTNWIDYFEYGQRRIRVERKDVILVPWFVPDPDNPALGLAPLRTAADDAETDLALTEYLKTVLGNGAVVPTAFSIGGTMISEARRDELREYINANFTGSRRGAPLILDGDTKAYKLGLDLKELAVDKLRNVPESRICAAFRVPPIIAYANMGLENATYNNLEGFERLFVRGTVTSLWTMVADAIERGMREEFDADINLHFDTSRIAALREDRNELETRVTATYAAGIRTKNEARKEIGLDGVPSGDVFADGSTPTAAKPEPEAVAPEPMPQSAEAAKARGASFKAAAIRGQGVFNEKVATAHFKAYDRLSQAGADKIALALADAFTALEKKLLSGIKESKGAEKKELDVADILAFWDEDFFTKLLEDAATEPTQELVTTMFQAAAANIKQDWDEIESEFDKKQKRVLQLSLSKIKETDATTRAQLQGLLEGMANAKVDDIRTVIKSKFDQYRDSKVNAIARTTATFATGAAQTEVWSEFGFEHEWLTQRDGKARQTHTAVDGDRPDEDGYFNVGADKMKFPASGSVAGENVNCRCTLIPVAVEEEKRYALAWDGRETKIYSRADKHRYGKY